MISDNKYVLYIEIAKITLEESIDFNKPIERHRSMREMYCVLYHFQQFYWWFVYQWSLRKWQRNSLLYIHQLIVV